MAVGHQPASGQALPAHSAKAACAPRILSGLVVRGQAFTAPVSPLLDFKLEAVPAGWIIRILPHAGPRPPHDAAELANPPYDSPTPLLLSTDFAFRAQDAVAWNPRNFRFFTTAEQLRVAEGAMRAIRHDPQHPAAGAALYPLLAEAAEAQLQIVDAEISGGTANQTAAAVTVATHFEQTAHQLRADLQPTPLGTILRVSFRLTVFPQRLLPGCR